MNIFTNVWFWLLIISLLFMMVASIAYEKSYASDSLGKISLWIKILGWIGIGLFFISCILFFISSMMAKNNPKPQIKQNNSKNNSKSSSNHFSNKEVSTKSPILTKNDSTSTLEDNKPDSQLKECETLFKKRNLLA